MPSLSYVISGGAASLGRAIVERLVRDGHVVILDIAEDLGWAQGLDTATAPQILDLITANLALAVTG